MKSKWIQSLILSSALCFGSASWGAIVTWSGGVANWDVGANWSTGNEPGSADTATINQNGAAVTINSVGNQVTTLNVMVNGGGNTSSLLIDTGGALTISGTGNNLWIAQQGNASPIGTLTVKGSLTYSGITQMSTYQNAGTTPRSSLIISGGTASIGVLKMADNGASTTASATFTLNNGGTFSGSSIVTGTGTNTFNLTPISTGIDVVNTSGALTLGAGNNILNVDLSSYNVANGTTMTLYSFGSRSGSWGSVNINGVNLGTIALGTPSSTPFTAGYWQGNFVVTSTSIYLDNLVYNPNPNRWWDGTNTGGTGDGASDGGTATWDTSTLNWDQGNGFARVAWVNGNNTAIFAGTAGTVSLGTGITVGGLQFDTASYIIQNNTLTWGTAGSIVANQNATISSIMAGSVEITKSGTGTLMLTAANTYSGGTIVSNGLLVLDKTGKNDTTPILAANSNLTITNATVSFAGGNTANAIYNTSGGTITLNGGGTLAASQTTFNAHNVYNVIMNGGLLTAGAGTLDDALANWYINNTISNTADSTISTSLGRNSSNGSLPVDVASGTTLLISGPLVNISGANGLTKSGAGTLRLSGTSTFTGNTTINAGTLEISGAGQLGSGSYAGTIANNNTFVFNSSSAQTLDGIISGAGAVVKAGSGALTLTAANTYSGGTIVSNGLLVLDKTGKNDTTPILAANSNLTITNATVSFAGGNTANAIYNTSGGTITLNGGGTLAASQATYNAHSLYNVIMNGGLLTAGAGTLDGTLANWYINNTISNTADSTISASLGRNSSNGSLPVDVASGTTLLISGPLVNISGANGLTKSGAGTLRLSGTSTFTGNTTINAGTLEISGAGQLGSGSYAGTIANNNTFVFNSSSAQTLGGIISGTGAVVKAGSGALTLAAKSTHTGGTTVDDGTLILTRTGNEGTIRRALTVNAGATVTSTVANSMGITTPVNPLNINGGNVDLSAGQHQFLGVTVNMVGGTLKFSSSTQNEHSDAVYNISNSTSQARILAQPGGAMRMISSAIAPCITFNVEDGSQDVDLLVDAPITVGSGAGGLTKAGAGTVEFTKVNTYTGPTAINAGRVFINGTSSGVSAHTVEIGATLAGTGTVNGATTVNGIIAPGSIASATGTLNIVGNVSWNGASDNALTTRDWYFDLGPNNTSDILNITGNFVKGSGNHFRFNFGGTTNQGTFILVDWSGTTTFSASDFSYDSSSLGNSQDVFFQVNGSRLEVVLYGSCPTPPTATLGASPTVCRGTTSASLNYSNQQQSPTLYTIDYDDTANTVGGFDDVSITALGASPITLAVPDDAPVGTYNASLYLVNGAGCRSIAIPFTVTVIDTPSTPGAISGSASVCQNTSGVIYSIAAVSMATTYNWTVPANGTIIGPQNGTSITVDWGAAGSGNITVNAQNSCDTSANQSLSVTVLAAAPAAPVANAAQVVTETSFIANWSSVSGASGYRLDVATTADFQEGTFVAQNQSVAGTSSTVGGLTSGVTYYYRVRASNGCGDSDSSDVISAVPAPILAAWDVSGLSNYGSSPQAATIFNDDVTVGGLTRGGGLSGGTSAVRGWGGTGWANLEADAISGNKYATFTIKGDANRNVSFTSISTVDYRLDSASGPVSGKLQYSLDGSTFTDVPDAAFTYDVSASGGSIPPIELSGIGALQNVSDSVTVTFRIVNYGASSASEPWYIYDKDNSTAHDFEVRGTICVSPTSYALNGGGTFCSDTFTDTELTLADSEVGVSYQLYTNNGVNAVGSPVAGTGNSISFGFHSAPDAYTVVGTRTAGSCSKVVGSATITVLTRPGTPTGFSATLNGGDVDLGWDAVAGASGYKIYRRLSDDVGYGAAVATVSGGDTDTYTDIPIGGLSYFYMVSAINGSCESDAASEEGPVAVPANCPPGIRPILSTQGLTALAASVRVNQAPSLDISIIAADSTGCDAPAFTMSGLPLNTPGSSLGITITDTPDSPAPGSHTRRIQWTPDNSQVGTYAVTLTATDSDPLATSITFVIHVGQQSDTVSGGVPSSQTNWSVTITNLVVPTSGNATVVWTSVDGVQYDVYSSTLPIGGGASWSKVVSAQAADGVLATASVSAAGSMIFYQVVPQGATRTDRGVWGVVKPTLGAFSMLAPPVSSDRRFDGAFGAALADAVPVGTLVHIMTPGVNPSWGTTLRRNAIKQWMIDPGGVVPYSTPLADGAAFFGEGASGSIPVFAGAVGNAGTNDITLSEGYNLVGLSEGKALSASTAFSASSMSADPVGSGNEALADQIILQNSNGSWRRLVRVSTGVWIDMSTGQQASVTLMPGQAYYYLRRDGSSTVNF